MTDPVVHIVDDDDSFRLSLLRLFKAKNIQAVGYATLAEFQQADVHGAPSCVLLDICMPDGDGLQFFERLVNDDVPRCELESALVSLLFVAARQDQGDVTDIMAVPADEAPLAVPLKASG